MTMNAEREITLPNRDLLSDPYVIQLLSIIAWCIKRDSKYLSRRTLIDAIADVFRDNGDVKMILPDGSIYQVPDIDEIFEPRGYSDPLKRGHEHELARSFMKAALLMPQAPVQRRTIEFLRLVDAAVRVGGPHLWRSKY
ncbi:MULTISPECIES: hypothetical protein [Alphaproteobacteria]|uniref:hypothetical protein n=1 Tax=Alphaproteobacteria TaxID=28211 RepID=UPI003299463B